jgi:hypothetical protein
MAAAVRQGASTPGFQLRRMMRASPAARSAPAGGGERRSAGGAGDQDLGRSAPALTACSRARLSPTVLRQTASSRDALASILWRHRT